MSVQAQRSTSVLVMRIHRDEYPDTDHGFTWVECAWFERDGQRFGAIFPVAGCTERLGTMPGGPIRCDLAGEVAYHTHGAPYRVEKSTDVHSKFHYVGSMTISTERS